MDWVLEHLRLLIGAAGIVAWWLNQRRTIKTDATQPRRPAGSSEDPGLAERIRRIREEIQRKIEERARAYAGPTPVANKPQPIVRSTESRSSLDRRSEPPVLRQNAHPTSERNAEILEQQAALAQRLQEAQQLKLATQRRLQFEKEVAPDRPAGGVPAGEFATTLRDPSALRRAFLFREIIGPPVALR